MEAKSDLTTLIKEMEPYLNEGDYVFVSVKDVTTFSLSEVLGTFREKEGTTMILKKEKADEWQLEYGFVASWISLKVHSALDAVGLTAAFSNALANKGISCNVIAGYYHDHIFVARKDAAKAMAILTNLTKTAP